MRRRKDQFPPVGQGCTPVHMNVGIYHKRDFCFCKEHSWLELNKCQECGEYFHTDRRNALTCSDKCRKRKSRRNRFGDKRLEALVDETIYRQKLVQMSKNDIINIAVDVFGDIINAPPIR